jgi:2-methylcitrate dehydratase
VSGTPANAASERQRGGGTSGDPILDAIVGLTLRVRAAGLPDAALRAGELRVLDAVGCALAALDAPAVTAARRAVQGPPGPARLWGSHEPAAVEDAGFVNSVAVRALDFNDTGGGHPSDVIGVLLAIAEAGHLAGRDVLEAMAVSYECQQWLWDLLSPERAGVDQGACLVAGAAAASAYLLRLDSGATAQAVSLAVVSHVPLHAVRTGQLSSWKAGAAPWAARQGYLAARLAAAGFTGPGQPFTGPGGLARLLGQPTPPAVMRLPSHARWAVERSHVKWWPVRFSCQVMIDAAIEARGRGLEAADIAAVRVVTYADARDYFERSADLRRPPNRETADHSLSFVVAAALLDGAVDLATFDRERYLDPDVVAVMERLSVVVDDEWSAASGERLACRVEVSQPDGASLVGSSSHALSGEPGDQARDQVVAKFGRLCAGAAGEAHRALIEASCLGLRDLGDAGDLIGLLHR